MIFVQFWVALRTQCIVRSCQRQTPSGSVTFDINPRWPRQPRGLSQSPTTSATISATRSCSRSSCQSHRRLQFGMAPNNHLAPQLRLALKWADGNESSPKPWTTLSRHYFNSISLVIVHFGPQHPRQPRLYRARPAPLGTPLRTSVDATTNWRAPYYSTKKKAAPYFELMIKKGKSFKYFFLLKWFQRFSNFLSF